MKLGIKQSLLQVIIIINQYKFYSCNTDSKVLSNCKTWSGFILRKWQLECNITLSAMQSFLKISQSLGLRDLPLDWRTVIRRTDEAVSTSLSQHVWTITEVCGHCFMISFDESDLKAATKCPNCNVSRITCSLCNYRCIVASSVGNKSRKALANCSVCGSNADVDFTKRSYLFDIREHLRRMFSSEPDSLHLLSPFRTTTKSFYSISNSNGRSTFNPAANWKSEWPEKCAESNFFKELWHGKRFYENPLFQNHGMRSVLYEVGLDWFPPHKEKQNYSVGVLAAFPANLPMDLRSDLRFMFVLGIIEGPREPKHTLKLIQPVFELFADIEANGIMVHDSLTKSEILVHATVALCVCDSPAAAKLGAFVHHSSYMPCIRCCYKGQICGHLDPIDSEPTVTSWDNEAVRNPSRRDRCPPVKRLGAQNRVRNKHEHIAFVDSWLLEENQLRKHSHVVDDQIKFIKLLFTPGHTKVSVTKLAKQLRVSGVSALSLLRNFSLVDDFAIDALHTLLKGIALKLIDLTFNKKYKQHQFNIKFHKLSSTTFNNRLNRFQFPQRQDTPKRLHTSTGGLKAGQIWIFCKVQCLALLRGLVPTGVFCIWEKLSTLISGLLHTHVSKSWVLRSDHTGLGGLMRSFYTDYLDTFGPCHMPYNFHLMLHIRLDCINWSSLRSHSAFKFERINHELMIAPRSNAESKVTQSIVRAVTELALRFQKELGSPVSKRSSWPVTLPKWEEIPCLALFDGATVWFSARQTDEFSNVWEVGNYLTAIDHAGTFPCHFTAPSPIAKIETFIHLHDQCWALLYPVTMSDDKSFRIKGAYAPLPTISTINVNLFRLVSLSHVPESVHISPVCSYITDADVRLLIPFCGPIPF